MENQESSQSFNPERVRQLLGDEGLGKLAVLHGLSSEVARDRVQQLSLGTRAAMEQAGLIEQTDTGNAVFEIRLTPQFELAVDVAIDK